jgi:hypothetical protein
MALKPDLRHEKPAHPIFLAYVPYFEKMKVGLCDLNAVSVSVNLPFIDF